MTKLSSQLEAAVDQWASKSDVPQAHVEQLRAALAADNRRLELLNEAAKSGLLKEFATENASRESRVG